MFIDEIAACGYGPDLAAADGRIGPDLAFGGKAFSITRASAADSQINGPSLTSGTPSGASATLQLDLERAVLFVNYMIKMKL